MCDFYSVEMFREGDIKSMGQYTLAGAYRVFANGIYLVENGEYDSINIFAWDDGNPIKIIAQFNDYDVEN